MIIHTFKQISKDLWSGRGNRTIFSTSVFNITPWLTYPTDNIGQIGDRGLKCISQQLLVIYADIIYWDTGIVYDCQNPGKLQISKFIIKNNNHK